VQATIRHCARGQGDTWLVGCAIDDGTNLLEALAPWLEDRPPD
jgi:hypothetical protein